MFRCLQGTVRFENGLSLSNCNGPRGTAGHAGNGGGIYNWETGNIVIKGAELGISDCGYNVSSGVSVVVGGWRYDPRFYYRFYTTRASGSARRP